MIANFNYIHLLGLEEGDTTRADPFLCKYCSRRKSFAGRCLGLAELKPSHESKQELNSLQ
jgi:hypothetical protein